MVELYNSLVNRKEKLAVIGLGYVGMPIAVAFSKKISVIGFDVDEKKVAKYKNGTDPTKEVGDLAIRACNVQFTSEEAELQNAKFLVVAVPTPVNADHSPDLFPVVSASQTAGRNLQRGSVVVYESTVYPGVTEDICVPILEAESGLKCGVDFKVGYSPERINPGDKVHRLETITKVVSGMDEDTLELIAKTYELIVEAGVYRAESIRVAEAAKVIENSQRDINIAFMNELSIIFNKMGIDTKAVLAAAGTKWNFLNFQPGLVGGHCIGVDPYYLTYKAEELGYHSQIISSGRRINDDMGRYVAETMVKKLIQADIPVKGARVLIMGLTFKEDCPDVRNTKVVDIIRELNSYGIEPLVCDPQADVEEAQKAYGITLCDYQDANDLDAIAIAVGHREFKQIPLEDMLRKFLRSSPNRRVFIDVKGILDKTQMEKNCVYWRL